MNFTLTTSRSLVALFIAIGSIFALGGCGTSDNNAQSFPSIDNLSLRDATVPAGGTTQVRVEFTPPSELTGTDSSGEDTFTSEAFTMVVSLPAGTSFVTGSSKLSDSLLGDEIFGGPDSRAPDLVGGCGDGRTILQYNFIRGRFGDTTTSWASFFVKFTLLVSSTANGKTITADSSLSLPHSACNLIPERTAIIVVG